MISVIIPARNEVYLQKTIASVLSAAEGDIEVIAVCDGYQPEPPLKEDERVTIIHHTKSIGQRPAINEAARIAKGKYIFKLDGHCMVDKGFDVKLAADCEYDWTVIPRMYVLDAEKWEPKLRKKTDFMFFRSPDAKEHPFRIGYYDGRCAKEFPNEYRAYKKAPWRQGDICDTMASLGAGWFMHRERFWDLGGMDEDHGHWGQMGVEIACKSWLSGGRQVVNKKTWFAHQWRPHAPWSLSQKQVDKARKHSTELWTNNRWPLQKYPLSWLIEKFSPVPGWSGDLSRYSIMPRTSDLTLLYYTANKIENGFRDKVIDQFKYACPDAAVVSVSQKPMTLGKNICVGDIGSSLQNIYKQVLIGAKEAKTEYVALVEDDCLYVPEHFTHRPKDCFAYNLNRWLLHTPENEQIFSYRKRPILSQCIAPTKLLIECLGQRKAIDIPKKYSGEMGLFEKKLGLKEYPYETFETKEPNVVVCHNKNTSGRKYLGKDAEPRNELAPWGNSTKLIETLFGVKPMARHGRGSRKRWQHSYVGSVIFDIEELEQNLIEFGNPLKKPEHVRRRLKVFRGIVNRIADGEIFDDAKLQADPCYNFFCDLQADKTPEYAHKRSMELMREWPSLYNDIKENSLKRPLDMYRRGKDKMVFCRGWRRFVIMSVLHKRGLRDFSKVPGRVYKSKEIFQKYSPSQKWSEGSIAKDSIHNLGMKQFAELGIYATDKYWVHDYTKWYDMHFSCLRDKKVKLLEIGVLRGASLLLWKEAFPKGSIYGIDKNTAIWKESLQGQKRIKVFVGRQEDESFIQSRVVPSGPYDIIIDDGGHTPKEQLASFEQLWPHVTHGGWYVIEDLHRNWSLKSAPEGPLMMNKIKEMVEHVTATNENLEFLEVACYYNICFVRKNR